MKPFALTVYLSMLYVTLALAAPVSAQASGHGYSVVELSGGYAFLAPTTGAPVGAYASAGWRPTTRFLLVGEVAAGHGSDSAFGARRQQTEWTALGGARLMPSPPGQVEPFIQILVGAHHFDYRASDDALNGFDFRTRTTDVALQYGLGLTWWLKPRVGTQIATLYERVFNRLGTVDDDEFQLLFGITIGLSHTE